MNETDRLQLEYEQTGQLVRGLTDIRFRLLAFVPTIVGTAVGLTSGRRSAVELLAIGMLGLAATLGILIYELRNSHIMRALAARARRLEQTLLSDGPLVLPAPGQMRRLFGIFLVSHGRGIALVYAAAVAGWSYLVAWGLLRAVELAHARESGLELESQ